VRCPAARSLRIVRNCYFTPTHTPTHTPLLLSFHRFLHLCYSVQTAQQQYVFIVLRQLGTDHGALRQTLLRWDLRQPRGRRVDVFAPLLIGRASRPSRSSPVGALVSAPSLLNGKAEKRERNTRRYLESLSRRRYSVRIELYQVDTPNARER
jgi:hypothetical protein